ncbi:MAG: phosphoribosylanthranilate isomerase [Gemmatimonadales bacterium]|nr:MAG: phosphoribosylanthranilate isomerase [Gemmatimonadales bacterium]
MPDRPVPEPAPVKIKICGITRPSDARGAQARGATHVGVIRVSESPRCVSVETAREIGAATTLPLVLVSADVPAVVLGMEAREAEAQVLQLHGDEGEADLGALRQLGKWELWKAIRVGSPEELLSEAERWNGVADAVLLDGWEDGRLGGTGTTFDWSALESVRGRWPEGLELVVAGGLVPDNVGDAVRRLRPHAVDASSGVESEPGIKDPERVEAFIRAARDAASPDPSPEDD